MNVNMGQNTVYINNFGMRENIENVVDLSGTIIVAVTDIFLLYPFVGYCLEI